MTIPEARNQELEARGTAGSVLVGATALGLALSLAQYDTPLGELNRNDVSITRTEGTLSRPLSVQIDEMEVFKQISRVYDELLRNQVELGSESKRVLYTNLWDLYT